MKDHTLHSTARGLTFLHFIELKLGEQLVLRIYNPPCIIRTIGQLQRIGIYRFLNRLPVHLKRVRYLNRHSLFASIDEQIGSDEYLATDGWGNIWIQLKWVPRSIVVHQWLQRFHRFPSQQRTLNPTYPLHFKFKLSTESCHIDGFNTFGAQVDTF